MFHRTCTNVSKATAVETVYRAKSALSGEVAIIMIWGTHYLIDSVCKVLGLIPYSDLIPSC